MLKRSITRPFGPIYSGSVAMNLPFLLPKFVMGDLTRKYSLIFTNVNASKINYVWDGKKTSDFFVMANGCHKVYTTVSILTVGGSMSITVCSDKNCIEDP
jgi:WS/DGAT C-terminal domain